MGKPSNFLTPFLPGQSNLLPRPPPRRTRRCRTLALPTSRGSENLQTFALDVTYLVGRDPDCTGRDLDANGRGGAG
eukprot:3265109-Rhodomonas_salina.2